MFKNVHILNHYFKTNMYRCIFSKLYSIYWNYLFIDVVHRYRQGFIHLLCVCVCGGGGGGWGETVCTTLQNFVVLITAIVATFVYEIVQIHVHVCVLK